MQLLTQILPFLIPVIIVELLLAITALIHVLTHPYYRIGNKAMWIMIVLVVQLFGPIIYFVFGREEDK